MAARPGPWCPPYCHSTALCGLVRIEFVQLVRFSLCVPLGHCALFPQVSLLGLASWLLALGPTKRLQITSNTLKPTLVGPNNMDF